jgi:hypothetical protein
MSETPAARPLQNSIRHLGASLHQWDAPIVSAHPVNRTVRCQPGELRHVPENGAPLYQLAESVLFRQPATTGLVVQAPARARQSPGETVPWRQLTINACMTMIKTRPSCCRPLLSTARRSRWCPAK